MSQKQKVVCPGCGASFDTRDQFTDHVVEKHESTCQICGAKLNSREELIQHNKEKHGW